jgi:hypothetical protein
LFSHSWGRAVVILAGWFRTTNEKITALKRPRLIRTQHALALFHIPAARNSRRWCPAGLRHVTAIAAPATDSAVSAAPLIDQIRKTHVWQGSQTCAYAAQEKWKSSQRKRRPRHRWHEPTERKHRTRQFPQQRALNCRGTTVLGGRYSRE